MTRAHFTVRAAAGGGSGGAARPFPARRRARQEAARRREGRASNRQGPRRREAITEAAGRRPDGETTTKLRPRRRAGRAREAPTTTPATRPRTTAPPPEMATVTGTARRKPQRPRRRRAHVSDDAENEVSATAEPAESGAGGRWLELAVGARGFSRNLVYNDQVSPGLRQYQLPMGPAAVASIAFYPLALATSGPAAGIGLVAEIEQAVGDLVAARRRQHLPERRHVPDLDARVRRRDPLSDSRRGLADWPGGHGRRARLLVRRAAAVRIAVSSRYRTSRTSSCAAAWTPGWR